MNETTKKDALENPIVIGKRYGYSQNDHGLTKVRIGTVIRETEMKVTLKLEVAKRGIYSDNLEHEPMQKEHISVKSNMLFPV